MPDVQLLPSPRVNPYAGENSKAVMSIMQILGSTEVARRRDIMTQNVLEALSRGEGREGISQAALMEPGFSGGIPGILQKIASPFAAMTPGIEDIIAGRGIESAFQMTSPSQMLNQWRLNMLQRMTEDEQKQYMLKPPVTIQTGQKLLSEEQRLAIAEADADKALGKTGPGFSPSDKKALGDEMDGRIKEIDKWHPGWKDFSEADIFREWEEFIAANTFDNDNQRENVWSLWKEKINKKGNEVDWDPTDPKWREAIGLNAGRTGGQKFPPGKSLGPSSLPATISYEEISPILEKAQRNGIARLDLYREAAKLKDLGLTKEEVLTAYGKLAEGATAEQIIEFLKSK